MFYVNKTELGLLKIDDHKWKNGIYNFTALHAGLFSVCRLKGKNHAQKRCETLLMYYCELLLYKRFFIESVENVLFRSTDAHLILKEAAAERPDAGEDEVELVPLLGTVGRSVLCRE